MSELHLRPTERTRPLVAVVCAVPLIGEAMMSALDFAEVRSFSERGGDIAGLLEWLRPDAVVVDSDGGAASAVAYATGRELPLLHISIRERTLRLFRRGEWHPIVNGEGPTPEIIRNVIAGALFAREEVRTS
jgi:hypothetical protein